MTLTLQNSLFRKSRVLCKSLKRSTGKASNEYLSLNESTKEGIFFLKKGIGGRQKGIEPFFLRKKITTLKIRREMRLLAGDWVERERREGEKQARFAAY